MPGASPRSLTRAGITHPPALIHTLTTARAQRSGRPLLRLLLASPVHAGSAAGPLRPGPARLMPRPAARPARPRPPHQGHLGTAGEAARAPRHTAPGASLAPVPTRRERERSRLGGDIGKNAPREELAEIPPCESWLVQNSPPVDEGNRVVWSAVPSSGLLSRRRTRSYWRGPSGGKPR